MLEVIEPKSFLSFLLLFSLLPAPESTFRPPSSPHFQLHSDIMHCFCFCLLLIASYRKLPDFVVL